MEINLINYILGKYTSGEADLEETNAALREAGASLWLDPERNTLTEEELDVTITGETPEEANGWGLLDTGTGTMDKVQVTDGALGYAVNQVNADGSTNMAAYVLIGGERYEVFGDRLGEVRPREPVKRRKVPSKPNLRRRSDLAGQEVMQHTRAGEYLVSYDDFGYAVSATRVIDNGVH